MAWSIAIALCSPSWAQAPVQAQPQPQPSAAANPPAASDALLSSAELEALVAPIALYPDALLAQVLMASTYPLEVVQADRWAAGNKKLSGDALKLAAEKQAWDDSVKALVATPAVLKQMSDKLDWTQKLGDAVLAQQPDIMNAVQRMRSKAYENKKLTSGIQQTVTVAQEQGRQTISIAPTVADTVYVPYYDPAVVYGAWSYPQYPPYYFSGVGYVATGVLAAGVAFGTAYALGRWATGGNYWGGWGGGVNWNSGDININRDRVSHWQHNSQHRQGVRYNNANVQQRFGSNTARAGRDARMDFRGRGGDQLGQPGGGRSNLSDRGSGDRVGADRGRGQRSQAGRPGAATRPAAGRTPGGRGRDGAFGNMQSGRAANFQSQRGRSSFDSGFGGGRSFAGGGRGMSAGGFGGGRGFHGGGGGGFRAGGGGGGFRGGGGGFGGGRGGGGRRSDIRLKHEIVLLGHLADGLGFYRFAYNDSDKIFVGVMAQEVQTVMPSAVSRGKDGYLRVHYERLGVTFQTYDQWLATGAKVPAGSVQR
ncbi:DUF3300 domain-containing protein [Bosea caraganae]|nr:DUF3300 domain-containing protein [Bosea caraganae]